MYKSALWSAVHIHSIAIKMLTSGPESYLCFCKKETRTSFTNSAPELSVDSTSPEAATIATSRALGHANLAQVAFRYSHGFLRVVANEEISG